MPGATGATSGANLVGIREFRRELKALGGDWPRELRKVHKKIADSGARRAQSRARGMGGVQAHFAGAIRGRANQRSASIGVASGAKNAGANVAFWGAEKRTGWYSRYRYRDVTTPQHPPWVGNTWDAAVAGQGPYAINAALADYLPELLEEYAEGIDDLARRAFPD